MSSPHPTQARITIIGAGPGGLTCARVLQQHGIPVTVHDVDPTPEARNQGGSLDLHADDGQVALREAGLLEEFFAQARFEGQEMRTLTSAAEILDHHVPDADERFKPEIDRGTLRTLLLDSLDPGTVHWGHGLDSVTGPADGPRTLHFRDGTSLVTDLVVAADGAWSKVRRAVSPALPAYTGVSFLEAWFDDVDHRHADLAELVGHGSAHAADGRRAMFAQRNSGDHIRVYIIQKTDLDWIAAAGTTIGDTAGLRAHLLTEFGEWSPRLRQVVTDNDGPYIDRPIFALPVPHTWDHNPTVALLGDAAHLMPPLGVGVNLAMLDASDLALALAASPTVDDAVRAYEDVLLPRSSEMATMLDHGAEQLLSTGMPDFGEDDRTA